MYTCAKREKFGQRVEVMAEKIPQKTVNPTNTFVSFVERLKALRDDYDAGKISSDNYVQQILTLDDNLTKHLKNKFNNVASFLVSTPEPKAKAINAKSAGGVSSTGKQIQEPQNIETRIIKQLEAKSDQPASFYTQANEAASRQKIVQWFFDKHPQLSTMTLSDAVALAEDTANGRTPTWKYGEADARVVLSAALTMMDNNKDRLRKEFPDMYAKITSGTFSIQKTIAEKFMVSAQDDDEFAAWETQRRNQIIAEIRKDRSLMQDIASIKPFLQSSNENDFLKQHQVRDKIADRLTQIYAKVYDLPDLKPESVTTVYASISKVAEEQRFAYAGGVPGVHGEDHAIIRNSLFLELMSDNPIKTNQDATYDFLQTIHEELRHTVDHRYTDLLVDDKLDQSHPAFRHTNLNFFNRLYYTNNPEFYSRQYVERTAKESSFELTQETIDDIFPQKQNPHPNQSPTLELPTTTIRAKPSN